MERNEFIRILCENAKEYFTSYNSFATCVCQACLETGYGKSEIMSRANAYFGIKATKSWKGKVFSAKTKEVYSGIAEVTTAAFRAYDNLSDSVADYAKLVSGKRYKDSLSANTVAECIKIIHENGYATDPDYQKKILKIYDELYIVLMAFWDEKCFQDKYTGPSIVEALNFSGIDSSYSNRCKIARLNGILGYKGSACQNGLMLRMYKEGTLRYE